MRRYASFFAVLITLLLASAFFIAFAGLENRRSVYIENTAITAPVSEKGESANVPEISHPAQQTNLPAGYVPFTSQAPFGQWEDLVFGGACEEASIVMAMNWIKGNNTLTKNQATEEIQSLADFQKEKYGYFYDTSAADTVKIIKEFYGYNSISLRYDVAVDDIIAELEKGNILIVPVNGQKLNNIFYTPPGPIAHMLVVTGYDSQTKEIITNDPGTLRGENFRYNKDVFDNALADYPSGYYESTSIVRSAMIVIENESR